MKNKSPAFIWYDADVVVGEGLAALEKGKSVYISGRLDRFALPLLRSSLGQWVIDSLGIKRGD